MSALARVEAAAALGRVLRAGAWANIVTRQGSEPRTSQYLVYGTLRSLARVDMRLALVSTRPLDRIAPELLDLLRVLAFELADDPHRAAAVVVDTGVHAASQLDRRYRGFANAVLRKLAAMGPLPEPVTASDRGLPAWLDIAVRQGLGDSETDALWAASDQAAPVGLRSGKPIDGAESVQGIADAWVWSGGAPPEGVDIQDPASVAVGNVVGVVAGMLALDMAAAPGGKTAQMLDAGADVVAIDVHRRRVGTGARRVPAAAWLVADGTRAPFRTGTFDRVLLDAPCSGLGTLRRRPEIRLRISAAQITQLAALQSRLLREGLRLVKPGGRLVYSVCTVTPAETTGVVEGMGGRSPQGLPGRPLGDGWLLSPDMGPTDGMFICVFDR